MPIKNKIIAVLEKNKDNFISGQKLADMLSVSRTAVWKNIRSLQKSGYTIEASTNKGYRLSASGDILSSPQIKKFLQASYKDYPIHVYQTVDSTNTLAKNMILNNAPHGTIIVSNEQTAGRGRFGRAFFSPVNTGIYMSVILKPRLSITDSSLITLAAALSVCKTIEKLTGAEPKIKWVNDIFLNGKKICGILTEAANDFESKTVDSVVVGIGVNIRTSEEQFPEELQRIAGSLLTDVSRNRIIAEIANNLFDLSRNLTDKKLISQYKSYSFILGKEISYKKDGTEYSGTATDINDKGNLVVKNKDNETSILEAGEISLRSKNIINN